MEKIFEKEISIIYKAPKKGNIIKIFGTNFVKINKNNCILIYDNKELILEEKIKIENNNNLKIIKIVLRIKNK